MSETGDALVWRIKQVALRSDLRIALAKDEPIARSLERCANALTDHLDLALAAFWWLVPDDEAVGLIAISRCCGPQPPPGRSRRSPIEPISRPGRPDCMPERYPLDGPGVGGIVGELAARVTNDLASNPELAPPDLVSSEKLTSFAGYPLLASDRPVGVMTLYGRSPMAEDTVEVMAWVADLISVTLESRSMGEKLREALEVKNREAERCAIAQAHIALQHQVAELLATASSLNEAAPNLVRALAQSLGWEVGALWHTNLPANLRTVTVWHAEDARLSALAEHLRTQTQAPESGLVAQVVRTAQPVHLGGAEPLGIAEDLPGRMLVRSALAFPVGGDEKVSGVFVFLSPQVKGADEELLRTLATIGSQVGQFVRRKLVEEQLIQAQKMEAVGKLAGGVAHDFNNILTVITGYAAMSLEQVQPENPLHDQAQEILSAAERATSLVNQLLAFSRKQVFHPRLIDLNVVVGDMDRMLRRLIGEDIRLVTRKPDASSMVRADLVHIEQVIVNLAVNSRDAMAQGGRLYIEISHLDAEPPARESGGAGGSRPFVSVIVRDTGVGMSEEIRAHLFEPFFTTKETGKGTGLGLATVYGIVRQNGGHVRVDSEPGKGAQFTIMFPRVVENAPAIAVRDPRTIAARGDETILLVEDEKPVRRLARNILKRAGYDVLEAGSAEEALQICARADRPIMLLLTDVVMPGMNGVELSRKLQEQCVDIRVLYMSGYAEDSLFDGRALSRGVTFLEKPFTPTSLAQRVRQVLDAPHSPKPSGSDEPEAEPVPAAAHAREGNSPA